MMVRRRCPNATHPQDQVPSPSGPRSLITSPIRAATDSSARAPRKASSPAIPHISPALLINADDPQSSLSPCPPGRTDGFEDFREGDVGQQLVVLARPGTGGRS